MKARERADLHAQVNEHAREISNHGASQWIVLAILGGFIGVIVAFEKSAAIVELLVLSLLGYLSLAQILIHRSGWYKGLLEQALRGCHVDLDLGWEKWKDKNILTKRMTIAIIAMVIPNLFLVIGGLGFRVWDLLGWRWHAGCALYALGEVVLSIIPSQVRKRALAQFDRGAGG